MDYENYAQQAVEQSYVYLKVDSNNYKKNLVTTIYEAKGIKYLCQFMCVVCRISDYGITWFLSLPAGGIEV